MDIGVGVLGAVNLNDPVNSWEINTTRRNIRTEKHCVLLLDELEVDGRTLVLILLTVKLEQILADLERLEGRIGKAYLLTTGEEYENLLLLMRLEEAKERVKFVLDRHFHVVVEQSCRRNRLQLCILGLIFITSVVTRYTTLNRIKVVDLDELGIFTELKSGELAH